MNFLNLEYFAVVAEELSFTKAAKRLYVSQQSLSNHVAKLEQYFGTALFDRKPPLTLTPAGTCLLQYARKLINTRDQAVRELQDIKDFKNGELSLGVSFVRGSVLLPDVLPEFNRRFPNVKVSLVEAYSSGDLTEELLKGRIDLVLGRGIHDHPQVVSEMLYKETMVVVAPLPVLKKTYGKQLQIVLDKLHLEPSISHLTQCPFLKMPDYTWVGSIMKSCMKDKKLELNIVMQIANIETYISLGLEGLGVFICPLAFLTHLDTSGKREEIANSFVFPLDYDVNEKYISVSYLRDKYMSRAAKEFIQTTKDVFSASQQFQ